MEQHEWLKNIGGLLADRSRSVMLLRLMDGRAYTATELARVANVAAPTASHHLERLEQTGVLERVRQGRHRYFRIADDSVAAFVEQALAVHAGLNAREVEIRCPAHLRQARLCYSHLAGMLGVDLLSAGLARGLFMTHEDRVAAGEAVIPLLTQLGIGSSETGHFCLDWSERRFHLAGPLATALTHAMIAERWLLRGEERRLLPTEKGRREIRRWFGI